MTWIDYFKPAVIAPQYLAPTPAPFSTQEEVLTKYNKAVNKGGFFAGMCQAMTNHYADILLHKEDSTAELKDDRKFLNASVLLENDSLSVEDPDHFAFTKNNVPHIHAAIMPGKTEERVKAFIEKSDHLLINIPASTGFEHEVYFGKDKASKSCRFFDANIKGGERKGACPELIAEFSRYLEQTYPMVNTHPSKVGMSI